MMCYLAGYELCKETELPFLWKAWWVLFVFLLNVVGLRHLLGLARFYRRRTRHAKSHAA